MKRTLDKKQSILVLLLISIFSLFIVIFSLKVLNQAKDLNLEAIAESLLFACLLYRHNGYSICELCHLKLIVKF
jgi:hypothetical protein